MSKDYLFGSAEVCQCNANKLRSQSNMLDFAHKFWDYYMPHYSFVPNYIMTLKGH